MRITYLYAENMAGIKEGPKLDKIEINFNADSRKIFTLLLGGNGCGKTVTLSLLHPFRETYDGRTVVRDGEKAYKEIHFLDGTDKFIIKHTWKPNKSYISLNGKELNDSGSIKLFNSIVKEKLGIDEDYFKIARLGSNVTNFINLTSGLRKTYVGNYLPYIDDYLSKYEIVKKKYTMLNKDLSNVANQLDKFPELDVLKDKSKTFSDEISTYETTIKKLNTRKTKLESNIDKEKELFEAKYNISCDEDSIIETVNTIKELSEEYDSIKRKYNSSKKLLIDIFDCEPSSLKSKTKFNNLLEGEGSKITYIKSKINNLTIEISKHKQTYDNLSKELEVYKNMSSIDYEIELEKLNKSIKDLSKLINSLEKEIEKINEDEENVFEYIESIDRTIDDFIDSRDEIDSIYKDIEILLGKYNIESEIDYNLLPKEKSFTNKLDKFNERKKELRDEIAYINGNVSLIDILNNRPKTCKDDSCNFISNALDYRDNHYNKLDDLTKELDDITDMISKYEKKIEIICNTKEFDKQAKEIYEMWKKFSKENRDLESVVTPPKTFDKFVSNFLKLSISYVREQLNLDSEISYFRKYSNLCELKENLDKNKEDVKRFEKEKKNSDKLSKHYRGIKNEIAFSEEKIDDLQNELDTMNNELKERNNTVSILEDIIECFDNLKEIKENINDLNETKKMYSEYLKKVSLMQENLDDIDEEIENNESILERLKEDSTKVNKDLNYVEVLSEDKKRLDTKFGYTKTIRDALDPKKGIPLLFIDKFLERIEEKTNELLDLAYGSTFRIKFDLTDRDFFIRVYKTFSELEDISLASQGETSLTTVSLSLAMIQYMVKHYNILYLDEIDGTLSNQNRRVFLSMLEKQIEELGIEQIFIITHNKEFYSYPVNLILLNTDEIDFDVNDSELMDNKHIDFNLSEYRKNKDSKLIINDSKRGRKKKKEEEE